MNQKASSPLEKAALDFTYILMVKSATFPVYMNTNNTHMELDGSVLVRLLKIETIEEEKLYHAMMHYPDLGKLEFLNHGEEVSEKAKKKMTQLCQKRGCLPHSFEYVELMAQVDVFCSVEEDTAIDEIDYIKHNLKEAYAQYFQTDECRFFAYNISYDRNHTGGYKMVEQGFQRVAFDVTFLVGIAKD